MPINTEGSKIPLFLVHSDHGNYTISDYFGPDRPVYGFFHPGSKGEEIIYKSNKEMAKAYLDQILSLRPSGPYCLSGYSFGGVLAFEMAVQLQKMGHEVPFLVIIDSISPLAREPFKWKKNGNIFWQIRKNILSPVKLKIEFHVKLLICKIFFLFNQPVPVKWRQFYRWETYWLLSQKYKPEKFKGSILLFRTAKNPSSSESLGWETLADDLKMFTIDIHHLALFKDNKSADILHTEMEKLLLSVDELYKE
jgi:thioesterase domain-containing protein